MSKLAEICAVKLEHIKERKKIVEYIKQIAKSGDAVIVMGSRDETLPEFAREILQGIGDGAV